MTHIIVGGAGIGGLTAALALAQADLGVTIIERRPAFDEIGAGLQLAPNATRILDRLGILPGLRAIATEPQAIRIRRGRDATALAVLPLGDAAQRRYSAPFLLIHRADLQKALAERVSSLGSVTVQLGVDVARVDAKGNGVSVVSTDPERTWDADGFVDARGLHIPRKRPQALRNGRRVAWRALVPAARLPQRYTVPESNLWLGPRTHLVHYPLRDGSAINVVAITEDDGLDADQSVDLWSAPGEAASLLRLFQGWHEEALVLLRAVDVWRRWPLADRLTPDRWSEGAVTRLGDSAHPMMPFLAQGASQAIEDAAGLADALREGRGVSAAFQRYEARRRPRALRVQQASQRQGNLYHLGRPASDIRDHVMRALGGSRALARMDWLYAPEPGPPAQAF